MLNFSVFSCIQTEYGDLQAIACKSPYSFLERENTEQKKKQRFRRAFSHWCERETTISRDAIMKEVVTAAQKASNERFL